MTKTEVVRASRNLHTPHPEESYPGILVVRPAPGWDVSIIVPKLGDSFVARGGEFAIGYETPDGIRAESFRLEPGDRATVVSWDAPAFLAEWRIERSSG